MAGVLRDVLGGVMQLSQVERERALALDAIFEHAPDVGIEQALAKFGASLSTTEKELIRTLTQEELKTFRAIRRKLGHLSSGTVNII